MEDLIMCITSGGQKMVGEDYSVPPYPHENKISSEKMASPCIENKFGFKHKPVAQPPDVITQYLKKMWLIKIT